MDIASSQAMILTTDKERVSVVRNPLSHKQYWGAIILYVLPHAASEEGVHIPIASMTDRVVAGAQLNPRLFVTDI